MSTVIVAAILVSIVTGSCLLLVTINNKEKRKHLNQLLHQFSELGSKYNLNFSGQEVLKDGIIGFDGIQRKLLIYKTIEDVITHVDFVDLTEVKSCHVKKQYGTINGDALTNKKLETYLERIALQLELKHNKGTVEIAFYDHITNQSNEYARMEQKAKYWEKALSKMVYVPVQKTA